MVAEQIAYAASGPDWVLMLIAVIGILLVAGFAAGFRLFAEYRKKTELS
jgi:hypothetical protein